MATVHQATDTALGRKVAVKIMDRVAAGEEFRTRFRQEARAVATLNHRNVITLHAIGEETAHSPDRAERHCLDDVTRSRPTPRQLNRRFRGRPASRPDRTGHRPRTVAVAVVRTT
ncbi:hypothetical protein ACH4C2_10450 [Streptomyces sp. NPDC018057]|uniref:hypothetical protein n=1 Tax=unclassified Streptomyces TaxID=2593676 RepID=UPI0037B22B0D